MRLLVSALTAAALTMAVLPAKAAGPDGFKENPRDCKNTLQFSTWYRQFKQNAASSGISQRTIERALGGIDFDPSVIRRDRRQGFFAQSFLSFQKKLATNNRVVAGRKKIAANKRAFERAEREFGVPAEVITGFWALESDFGKGMGNLSVLRSLVTLAYDCRRGEMFTEELKAALKIIDRGDLDPAEMIGSCAGELGQTQFLPTRYLEYAIDYDGDKHPNLFKSDADIIGSTANYMKYLGWKAGIARDGRTG